MNGKLSEQSTSRKVKNSEQGPGVQVASSIAHVWMVGGTARLDTARRDRNSAGGTLKRGNTITTLVIQAMPSDSFLVKCTPAGADRSPQAWPKSIGFSADAG